MPCFTFWYFHHDSDNPLIAAAIGKTYKMLTEKFRELEALSGSLNNFFYVYFFFFCQPGLCTEVHQFVNSFILSWNLKFVVL